MSLITPRRREWTTVNAALLFASGVPAEIWSLRIAMDISRASTANAYLVVKFCREPSIDVANARVWLV